MVAQREENSTDLMDFVLEEDVTTSEDTGETGEMEELMSWVFGSEVDSNSV